jgi:ribosomal protein S8
MNKLIKEALKDIRNWREIETVEECDSNLKYWLTRMYRQGYIAGLEWTIENRKQHGK